MAKFMPALRDALAPRCTPGAKLDHRAIHSCCSCSLRVLHPTSLCPNAIRGQSVGMEPEHKLGLPLNPQVGYGVSPNGLVSSSAF